MNIKDKDILPDINRLPAALHAYWQCVHALINTYEFQKKSAQETAIWVKKVEAEKIANIMTTLMLKMKEKEKREFLEEEMERHYNELKKIMETSLEEISKIVKNNNVSVKDILEAHELLTTLKNCEAQMLILWQKITELTEKREYLFHKIQECNHRIEELDEVIAISEHIINELDKKYDRIIDESFLLTGAITQFDFSKLQSEDPRFMEIIRRGIEIANIYHDNIVNELKAHLCKDRPTEKEAVEKIVNDLTKLAILKLADAQYAHLSDEDRACFIKELENSEYYKLEVSNISNKIMSEVWQEKIAEPLQDLHVEKESNLEIISNSKKEQQEKVIDKEKYDLGMCDVDSENEKAQEEFRIQAEQREALLKRMSQMKAAKKQLDLQPLSATEISRILENKQMKNSESVVVLTQPTYDTLDKLPITSNTAYVLYDKQLYFINKETKECRNLNLPKDAVEKLTKESVPFSLECQKLSESHLMKIERALRNNIKQDRKVEEGAKLKETREAQNDPHFVEHKARK